MVLSAWSRRTGYPGGLFDISSFARRSALLQIKAPPEACLRYLGEVSHRRRHVESSQVQAQSHLRCSLPFLRAFKREKCAWFFLYTFLLASKFLFLFFEWQNYPKKRTHTQGTTVVRGKFAILVVIYNFFRFKVQIVQKRKNRESRSSI